MEVETHFKSTVDCACGCGKSGTPRTKAWRDGMHTRDCVCRSCTSGQHAKNEKRRVKRFARNSGLLRSARSGALNGFDLVGVMLIEETSARAIVEPIERWFARKDVQAKIATVAGQTRKPWGLALSWDDKVRVVITNAESIEELCQAAAGPDYSEPPR